MSHRLRILYVAYPLLPVSRDSCGGAEQILCALERLMHQQGHVTTVAACGSSQVAGELLATGSAPAEADQLGQREREHRAAIIATIRERERQGEAFDLIHDHSGSFWQCASQFDLPLLVTLHLPRQLYHPGAFSGPAPNVFFNCVSGCQYQQFTDLQNFASVVENGVDLEQFRPHNGEREPYLLWMGRICEEKGPHLALDVAEATQLPVILAGEVYPFSYHQQYYQREIVPRLKALGSRAKHIVTPTFSQKLKLLQRARAVLIPSTVEETSSLVAMEAMACGTPVIAFHRGALAQIVVDGVTGFLVESAAQMAESVKEAAQIDANTCRRYAEQFYSEERMAGEYERLYEKVLKSWRARRAQELVA